MNIELLLSLIGAVGVILSGYWALTKVAIAAFNRGLDERFAAQDKALLSRADGVGPKLAQRIAIELKDKAAGLMLGHAAKATPAAAGAKLDPSIGVAADAVSALVNLGYCRAEAFGAVATASQVVGAKARLEDLIRAGLRELGK